MKVLEFEGVVEDIIKPCEDERINWAVKTTNDLLRAQQDTISI